MRERILERGEPAAKAWLARMRELMADYATLSSPYLRARASDVQDVGQRVTWHLAAQPLPQPPAATGAVLVALDLSASQLMALDGSGIAAICLAQGSATSHAALLAQRLGLPMVVGLGPAVLDLAPGAHLAVDGSAGTVSES